MKAIVIVLCCIVLSQSAIAQATKKVVLEGLTASWCGLCPEGKLTYDSIMSHFDNVIGVGAHVHDPMSNELTNALSDEFSGGGVNVFLLDRYLFEGRNFVQFTFQYEELAEKMQERLHMTTPVSVSIENIKLDADNRQLTATIRADFYENLSEQDLRFNLWLTEDSIIQNEIGYTQTSYFNNYEGHPYAGAGNPIYNFTHNSVMRQALGGIWGSEGSLPSNVEAGSSYQFTYTTTLSPDWNLDQIYIVGLVQGYGTERSQQSILNAEDIRLKTVLEEEIATNIGEVSENHRLFRIYPNPVDNRPLQLAFDLRNTTEIRLQVLDMNGRLVRLLRSEKMNQGLHTVRWNLEDGNGGKVAAGGYWIVLEDREGKRQVQKLLVTY